MDFMVAARAAEPPVELDRRWARVAARDGSADGEFYYSVRTTGVYCRPSCASRLANPRNVRFHATREDAERAGFRPCKRCRPEQSAPDKKHAAAVARVCQLIESTKASLPLARLANVAGLSPHHFHRVFKAATGLTAKQYSSARRNRRVHHELKHSQTVTQAIYGAGYNSGGRFYADADAILGMTPTQYRDGGERTAIKFAVGECSLGAVLVAASERGVCAISLGENPDALVRDLQDRFAHAELTGGDTEFEAWVAKVVGFIEAPAIGLDLPLDIRGTAFQHRVWQALRKIPAGTTMSYSEIARHLGQPKAARAVAGACAANPLAVAIPCHRVIKTDGALSGYRWGIDRKKALLTRESQNQ
jgi:AraC family transcriptional regulator of adaptative response/methylated-DNA-[protein]-cysteine methyltransferase